MTKYDVFCLSLTRQATVDTNHIIIYYINYVRFYDLFVIDHGNLSNDRYSFFFFLIMI